MYEQSVFSEDGLDAEEVDAYRAALERSWEDGLEWPTDSGSIGRGVGCERASPVRDI